MAVKGDVNYALDRAKKISARKLSVLIDHEVAKDDDKERCDFGVSKCYKNCFDESSKLTKEEIKEYGPYRVLVSKIIR